MSERTNLVGRDAPGPSYLATLNPVQRAAAEALDRPVPVLAGAGTGKTRVLTTRLVHLIASRRAGPGQILAVNNPATGDGCSIVWRDRASKSLLSFSTFPLAFACSSLERR